MHRQGSLFASLTSVALASSIHASITLQLPTTMFRPDEINLTHVTTPREFRVHDAKAANAAGVPWPLTQPWPPCPVWRGGSL
jgi:hypothetical protein